MWARRQAPGCAWPLARKLHTASQLMKQKIDKIINQLSNAVKSLERDHSPLDCVRGGWDHGAVIRRAAKLAGVVFTPKWASHGEEFDVVMGLLLAGLVGETRRVCGYNVAEITGSCPVIGGVQTRVCGGGAWAASGGDDVAVF